MPKMRLVDNQMCFACGRRNPIGLKLKFHHAGDELRAEFAPTEHFQGFEGIFHGGMMALVLDEIMVNLAWTQGLNAVSSEFRMRLKHAARIGESIRLSARVVEKKKRLVITEAKAHSHKGRLLAEATAKCVRISGESTPSGERT